MSDINKTHKPTLMPVECKALSEGKTMKEYYDDMCIDVLARTLWGEARNQGTHGMQAVANVVMNRTAHAQEKGRFWWGNNVIQVCQKPYQFSCWNRNDPNFSKVQSVDESDLYFASAVRIARRAVIGVLDDITNGATHYHTKNIAPYWAKGRAPCAEIGSHVFYHMV
jgi:N-acetylmuramoyl-L-alanine amidase